MIFGGQISKFKARCKEEHTADDVSPKIVSYILFSASACTSWTLVPVPLHQTSFSGRKGKGREAIRKLVCQNWQDSCRLKPLHLVADD